MSLDDISVTFYIYIYIKLKLTIKLSHKRKALLFLLYKNHLVIVKCYFGSKWDLDQHEEVD